MFYHEKRKQFSNTSIFVHKWALKCTFWFLEVKKESLQEVWGKKELSSFVELPLLISNTFL